MDACQAAFESQQFPIKYTMECRNLVSCPIFQPTFVGDKDQMEGWIEEKIVQWTVRVKKLAKIAKCCPQTVYVGLTFIIQAEWIYVSRMVKDFGRFLQTIEDANQTDFLPTLFDDSRISNNLHVLLSHFMNHAMIEIQNLVDAAEILIKALENVTAIWADALLSQTDLNLPEHQMLVREAQTDTMNVRVVLDQEAARAMAAAVKGVQLAHHIKGSKSLGAWLTCMPNRINETALSAKEVQDNLRL